MRTIISEDNQEATTAGIKKEEERGDLFGEILHRIDKIDGLFQLVFVGGLTF